MRKYHGNDQRKVSGGSKNRHRRVKRRHLMGREPAEAKVAESESAKKIRTRGGNLKMRLLRVSEANVAPRGSASYSRVKVLKVLSNPASQDFTRRGVVTRGAIIETEIGKAKVVSRPGQDGVVNAVLLEE